jgi:general secretion pathway protein G
MITMKKSSGFTLIELLIVVAIIAILAAIAVPNFLEAQTRSKVSRCKADMRTQVTALESYYVDNNHYPPAGDFIPAKFTPNDAQFHARMPNYLTTPISYLTSLPLDPFVSAQSTLTGGIYEDSTVGQRYAYFNWQWYLTPAAGGSNPSGFPDYWNGPIEWTGEWLMYGYGPDRTPFHGAGATFMPYDSTNGTISAGNIIRCQKDSDGIPPHPVTGTYLWQ